MRQFTFSKKEHLTSKRDIEALFASKNKSVKMFPLRAIFREADTAQSTATILISVSKRLFKHAVDRNRAKRQVREAYRLHKQTLLAPLQEQGKKLHIAFIWTSEHPVKSTLVADSMQKLLQDIAGKYHPHA